MDSQEINLAARARSHEALQPVEARGAIAVAHRGRADLDLAAELLHVGFPCVGGVLGGHVGLGGEVGLVEAEDVGRAVGDGGVGVFDPLGEMLVGGAPEHGDEVHGGGDGAAGLGIPVVGPADGGAFEKGGQ